MDDDSRTVKVERLVSVQRAARAVAESAAAWWQRVAEAADTATADESLAALYREALGGMHEVLGAEEVSILIANDVQDALVARTSTGLGEQSTVSLNIPAGAGMAGRVLATKQPLVIGDLDEIELVSPVLKDQGLRSVVAVPILSGREVLGVLHAGSRKLDHFTATDAELLGFLAERMALALERVSIFERQRRLTEEAVFLADTARIMAGASSLTETLDELARAALPVLGDICLIDMLDEGSLRRVVAHHVDPEHQPLVDRLRTEFAPHLRGDHPAVQVIRDGQPRWSPSMTDEFLKSTTYDAEHFGLTKSLGFRSYLAVPIASAGAVLGTLTLVSCSRPLDPRDVELASSLAREVGTVVSKAQQLDRAAETSRVLQDALLPTQLPVIPGLAIETRYEAAAASLDVGGDFYDVALLPDGRVWFMIGDVEGHDRRAAAVMGQLRSAIRTLASESQDPAGVLLKLQTGWRWLDFVRFATVLVGLIDPRTGAVTLASAGHPPPLLVDGDDASYLPVVPSPPLGVGSDPAAAYQMEMQHGQVLVLFTDGALMERYLEYSESLERLCKVALGGQSDVKSICQRLVENTSMRDDDLALLAISRL